MPPKKKQDQKSSKTVAKEKAKIVEDKTFGLKNKNKSKSVQKYVHSVQQNVKSMGGKDVINKEKDREKKKQEKEEKKLKELEMQKLGYAEEKKKKKEQAEVSASAEAAAERGEYLWSADDFEAVEVDNDRLEEKLEKQRQEIAKRTNLTPVNEKTFQKWWADKQRRMAKEREAERKKMIRQFKTSGGGISGRALFEHDRSIFVDDADADEEIEVEVDEEWERAKREAQEKVEAARKAKASQGTNRVDSHCEAEKGAANLSHDAAVAERRHMDPWAAGGGDEPAAAAAAADGGGGGGGGAADAAVEDEELFDGEDLPDDEDDEDEEDGGGGKAGAED